MNALCQTWHRDDGHLSRGGTLYLQSCRRQACRQVGRVRDAGWWLVRARDTTTNNSTTASSPTFPLQQLPLPALPTLHVSSLSLLRWDRMHARVLACGHELHEAALRSAHGGGCVVQAELPRRSPERTGPWSRVARLASRRCSRGAPPPAAE